MYQKTFEVLQAIDDLVTEYYEKPKMTVIHMKNLRKDYAECFILMPEDLLPQEIFSESYESENGKRKKQFAHC